MTAESGEVTADRRGPITFAQVRKEITLAPEDFIHDPYSTDRPDLDFPYAEVPKHLFSEMDATLAEADLDTCVRIVGYNTKTPANEEDASRYTVAAKRFYRVTGVSVESVLDLAFAKFVGLK
jgi:hypothetical protein